MSEHLLNTPAKAAPSPLGRAAAPVGASRAALGWAGGLGGPLGGQPPAAAAPPGSSPQAREAGKLTGAAKHAKGDVSHVAPALAAAARGETVAQQAARVTGAVKMSAADALRVAGALIPDPEDQRAKLRAANPDDGSAFHSPFVTIGLSGITADQNSAEHISSVISGSTENQPSHGYAAYGPNDDSYRRPGSTEPGVNSPTAKLGVVDGVNDTAAVTQYAAAAELGIKLTPNAKGDGRQVQIDWGALSKMDVKADVGALGLKVKYDNPAAVANNGYQAVLADMAAKGGKPEDKGQFISLTGHSGGGQSSFYTALKLASEGYKNVSLVGVDMAMTPHQREVLVTLGVNVTNITSNDNNALGHTNSAVGDAIRTGMGGGQNYYDLNVARQNNSFNPAEAHGITNDANVATTVRFAQYLDSIGQHGNYSKAQYDQFLNDTNGKGNQVILDKDGKPGTTATAASDNLFTPGSGLVADQRNLPGAEANNPAGGSSTIERLVNTLGGKPVTAAFQSAGSWLHNKIDGAGETAGAAISDKTAQAGGWLGRMFHKGTDLLGRGVNAIGNTIGNGFNAAGNFAQSAMSGVANVSSSLGAMASNGLQALGNGVSSVGNTIGNGLDKAGDKAQSWLGGIPLIGGFLGNVANGGLDLLGSGVSAAGNLLGNGANAVGDAAQWAGGKVASGANALGGLAHQGLDAVGSGARGLGGLIGSGLNTLGGWGQSAITGAAAAAGNFLGSAASTGMGLLGSGVDGAMNLLGHGAGGAVSVATLPLVWKLQQAGVDTSQIDGLGLANTIGFNRSNLWNLQMGVSNLFGGSGNVQTLPEAAPPQHSAASAPVHAHYAN